MCVIQCVCGVLCVGLVCLVCAVAQCACGVLCMWVFGECGCTYVSVLVCVCVCVTVPCEFCVYVGLWQVMSVCVLYRF